MSTKGNRVLLPVRRWKQRPSECAIAAMTAIASYYDKEIDYNEVRSLVPSKILRKADGLYTSQSARLLNNLGFEKVTIVTADLILADISWQGLGKDRLLEKLKRKRAYFGRSGDPTNKEYVDDMINWLEECDGNNLVIDYNFPKYIKRHLDNGRPVGACFSWTKVFKLKKKGVDELKGDEEQHAVVIRGYDDKGVFIVDGHQQFYRGKLNRYRNGYYKMPWNKYLVTAPEGDLILAY